MVCVHVGWGTELCFTSWGGFRFYLIKTKGDCKNISFSTELFIPADRGDYGSCLAEPEMALTRQLRDVGADLVLTFRLFALAVSHHVCEQAPSTS